jgi:hypothetical protein
LFLGAGDGAGFTKAGVFGDTVRDEIHRIIAGHILFLKEIGRVRFAFGKDRHQHIGPRHLIAARGLHMDRRALDDALKGGGRHGFGPVDIGDKGREIIVDELFQRLFQRVKIDTARPHDARGIGFIKQRQQQMFKRCKFVAPGVGKSQRAVDRLLQSV